MKLKLGRTSKTYERKIQASQKHLVGCPHTNLRNIRALLESDGHRNNSQVLQEPESLSALAQKQLCNAVNFEQVKKSVASLPRQWSNQSTSDGNTIQVCKTSQTESHDLVVTHSVTINNDLSMEYIYACIPV